MQATNLYAETNYALTAWGKAMAQWLQIKGVMQAMCETR